MKIVKTAVGVALVAAGLLAGGTTASAGALYTVTTWHDVKIRTCAATSCSQVGSLLAGQSRKVACWVHGESITDAGITNDVWLRVGTQDGGTQWASAVYFVGDEYAGVPADEQCPS